jgi:glycine dehydrogenase subunit 1
LSRYTSVTEEDLDEMLATIGVASTEELFADVPAELRLTQSLGLDEGLSEQGLHRAARARSTERLD